MNGRAKPLNSLVAYLQHRNHRVALHQKTRPEDKGNDSIHFFRAERQGWEKMGFNFLKCIYAEFVECHEQPHVPNVTTKS